jgi:hypothetical protein
MGARPAVSTSVCGMSSNDLHKENNNGYFFVPPNPNPEKLPSLAQLTHDSKQQSQQASYWMSGGRA